jgi:hypothetical protein
MFRYIKFDHQTLTSTEYPRNPILNHVRLIFRSFHSFLTEKSVQSSKNAPKSTISRSIAQTTHHNNKATRSSLNGEGHNDPPHPKIDSSQRLPLDKSRKQFVGQAEEPEIQSENIELEPDLDSIFHYLDKPRDAIQHSHPMDISDTKHFNDDESFVFQSIVFYSQSKKLIIEKKDVKNNKGKYYS